MYQVRAGFGSRDITPAVGATLSGFGDGRPSDSIRDRLTAKALALVGPDGFSIALVSTDVLLMADSQVAAVLSRLESGREWCCLINHTHTHSGPALAGLGNEPPPPLSYERSLVDSVADAVQEASETARPARISVAIADAPIGVNRRPCLRPNLDGPYDPTGSVIRVDGVRGDPIACWFTMSAHPTILRGSEISADWPGVAAGAVSEAIGCPALFAQGCAGDVMPRWDDVTLVGQTAAKHIVEAWSNATEIRSSLRSGAVVESTLAGARQPSAREHLPILRVQAVAIGDLTIVALNAEPFVRIGVLVRELSPTPRTAVLGYTNGCFGYLPDREAFSEPPGRRGYELDDAPIFFRTPPLTAECVPATESAAVEALSELPPSG